MNNTESAGETKSGVENDTNEKLCQIDDQRVSPQQEYQAARIGDNPGSPNNTGKSQETPASPKQEDAAVTGYAGPFDQDASNFGKDGSETEDENMRTGQFNSVFTQPEEDVNVDQEQPLAPLKEEEIASMVQDLTSEIKSVEPSSWEDYKPRLIQHLRYLGMEHFVPCEPLEPAISGNPTKRLNAMLTSYGEELAKIPSELWDQTYWPELARLCGSEDILRMSFQQRLSKIGRIVYLREEEAVLASGDWERLRIAVRLCALLSQATGPETEQAQGLADKYTASKIRDISWLEKSLKARDTIRSVAQRATGTGQSADAEV